MARISAVSSWEIPPKKEEGGLICSETAHGLGEFVAQLLRGGNAEALDSRAIREAAARLPPADKIKYVLGESGRDRC
jgi:hypothetical protein